MPEDRKKNMNEAVKQLEEDFGKGTLMKLGERNDMDIDVIPSGSIALDIALGVQGFPKGRIVEIYGNNQVGKTTLALHAIAECQKLGGVAAFLDLENAVSLEWAKLLGVDVNELYFSQPEGGGEEALEIVDTLVTKKAADIIVVDSVSALVPKSELEGDMGESPMANQARLMSQAMRKLTGSIKKANTCVIFLNQTRHKIGVTWGSPITTSGGVALKFYASVRIECSKGEFLKEGDEIIGHIVKAKIVKNKVSTPHKLAEIPFYFEMGYNNYMSLVDIATTHNIIAKSGTWYSYGEEKLGQGRVNVSRLLGSNKELYTKIETEVKKVLGMLAEKVVIEEEPKKKRKKKNTKETAEVIAQELAEDFVAKSKGEIDEGYTSKEAQPTTN